MYVCMYVCMCIYVFTYVWVYMCVYICIYMYVCMYVCMSSHTHACIHTDHTYARMHTYKSYIHTYTSQIQATDHAEQPEPSWQPTLCPNLARWQLSPARVCRIHKITWAWSSTSLRVHRKIWHGMAWHGMPCHAIITCVYDDAFWGSAVCFFTASMQTRSTQHAALCGCLRSKTFAVAFDLNIWKQRLALGAGHAHSPFIQVGRATKVCVAVSVTPGAATHGHRHTRRTSSHSHSSHDLKWYPGTSPPVATAPLPRSDVRSRPRGHSQVLMTYDQVRDVVTCTASAAAACTCCGAFASCISGSEASFSVTPKWRIVQGVHCFQGFVSWEHVYFKDVAAVQCSFVSRRHSRKWWNDVWVRVLCMHVNVWTYECVYIYPQVCMYACMCIWRSAHTHTWLRSAHTHTWLRSAHAHTWLRSAHTHTWLRSAHTHTWLRSAHTHTWLRSAHAHTWLRVHIHIHD
jgi:hypothetical protein